MFCGSDVQSVGVIDFPQKVVIGQQFLFIFLAGWLFLTKAKDKWLLLVGAFSSRNVLLHIVVFTLSGGSDQRVGSFHYLNAGLFGSCGMIFEQKIL